MLGGGGYALSQGLGDDEAGKQASPTSSAPATPTSLPSTAAPSTPTASGSGADPSDPPVPLVAGWRVQTDTDSQGNKAAVDVPGIGWKLGEESTIQGYETHDGKDRVTGHSPMEFKDGYCAKDKNDQLALIVFQSSGDRDPADVGPDSALRWEEIIGLKEDGTREKSSAPVSKQVAINGGKTQAVQTRLTIPNTSPPKPDRCSAPKYEVITQSFTTGNATATLVVVRDVGVPGALDDATLDKILASARPVS